MAGAWAKFSKVFSSALVIFAAMIVQHRGVIQIESFQSRDMKIVIQHALDAIQYLGSDSRMSSRCRKYLKKLMNRVLSLGKNKHFPRACLSANRR